MDRLIILCGFVFLILAVLLTGCSTTGQALEFTDQYKLQAIEQIKEINDRLLEDSEMIVCQGASIGAIDRRYSGMADEYKAFCGAIKKMAVSAP